MMENAIICLALNVFHEARGESYEGQKAVAQVTFNRASHRPEKVCEVVFAPKQFSWANGLTLAPKKKRQEIYWRYMPDFASEEWRLAKKVSKEVIAGHGHSAVAQATFYYNPQKCKPQWKSKMVVVARIGNHIFLRNKET